MVDRDVYLTSLCSGFVEHRGRNLEASPLYHLPPPNQSLHPTGGHSLAFYFFMKIKQTHSEILEDGRFVF